MDSNLAKIENPHAKYISFIRNMPVSNQVHNIPYI